MGRYLGELSTDTFGVLVDETKVGTVIFTAAQAAAAGTDNVKAAFATSATVVTNVTTGITNPPCARNLQITPGGTTADVKEASITVTGTDISGAVITEDFAFAANATAATVGAKAFKTVTKISVPAQDGAGATYAVGFGDKLGLPFVLDYNAVLGATLNGVREATFPTVAYSSTVLASNTVDLNSNLAGTPVKIFIALD